MPDVLFRRVNQRTVYVQTHDACRPPMFGDGESQVPGVAAYIQHFLSLEPHWFKSADPSVLARTRVPVTIVLIVVPVLKFLLLLVWFLQIAVPWVLFVVVPLLPPLVRRGRMLRHF